MRDSRPTISDVAREAGVSKATVSAVLNEKGTVSESTRARVRGVMERLNYRPSAMARRGGGQRARSLGLLIKETDNPFYSEIITAVWARANAAGYTLLVTSSEGQHEAELRIFELLRSKDVDGILVNPVFGAETDLTPLFELKRRNFPLVLLEEIHGLRASLVDIDNVDATRRATEHLIRLGHTRIALFGGPRYSVQSKERAAGLRRAFSETSLVFRDDLLVPAGARMEDGYRVGMAFFGGAPSAQRPTAVVCFNDLVAIGLLRALRELGLRVPEDVSVVGHDDIELLAYLPIGLTTVHIPKREMARLATDLLIEQIESPAPIPPRRVIVEVELVVRDSTCPPAAGGDDTAAAGGDAGGEATPQPAGPAARRPNRGKARSD